MTSRTAETSFDKSRNALRLWHLLGALRVVRADIYKFENVLRAAGGRSVWLHNLLFCAWRRES